MLVFNVFRKRVQVCVINTDFKNVFDALDHNMFLIESSYFGIPLVVWFKSYLNNKYEWIKIHEISAKVFLATSEVAINIFVS